MPPDDGSVDPTVVPAPTRLATLHPIRPSHRPVTVPGQRSTTRHLPASERHLTFPDLGFDEADWDTLQVPAGLALVTRSSNRGGVVVTSPGPTGVLQGARPLESWGWIVAANPQLDLLQPDVEALVLRRAGRGHSVGYSCHLVPIASCHELADRLRTTWRGLDGGRRASRVLDVFFATLERLSRPAPPITPADRRRTP